MAMIKQIPAMDTTGKVLSIQLSGPLSQNLITSLAIATGQVGHQVGGNTTGTRSDQYDAGGNFGFKIK